MSSDRSTELFSTDRGILAVQSPVKKRILHLLSEGEKTEKEIEGKLNRAKSTISVHLSDLEELGLIDERPYPPDRRKKLFSLSASPFGKSKIPSDKHYKEILRNLRQAAGNSYEFLRCLFHLVRYGFDSLGMDVDPALKQVGRDTGRSLAKDFKSDTLPELLKEIQDFWKDNRLGELEVENDYLIVSNCFDCGGLPAIGETVCSLDEGMIEGIIEEKTDMHVTVRETECFGTGNKHCKFELDRGRGEKSQDRRS